VVGRELCKQLGWPARTYRTVEAFFAIRISEGLIWERKKAGAIELLRRDLVLEATRVCPIRTLVSGGLGSASEVHVENRRISSDA
jgi:hypothetical protein